MDISKLSTKYQVRRIGEADIDQVLALFQGNPLFYQYCPPAPSHEGIREDLRALPPGTTYEDKFYLGFWDGDRLLAVLDLILSYPNPETAFIGFFMVNAQVQGAGVGSCLTSEIVSCLQSLDFRYTRLCYVKGNPQSRAFWHKNGFRETGVEAQTERYTMVVMERENRAEAGC